MSILIQHQDEVLNKIKSYGDNLSYHDFLQFVNEPGLVYDYGTGCLRCFMPISVGCSAIDSSGKRVILRDAPHKFLHTASFYFEACEEFNG